MSPDEQEVVASGANVVLFNVVNSIVAFTGYGAFILGITIATLSLPMCGQGSNFIHPISIMTVE
ncbi:hypothetical protein EV360DRAFT_89033 [Lentinula raphanica]|nr:hypothetical protein EV360DRAFT_89033 [Lentinula raphanica]